MLRISFVFQKSNWWHGKAGHRAEGWELQLPGSHQELLFLLILALQTAQQRGSSLLICSAKGAQEEAGENCRHGWGHTAQHNSVFLKSALFCSSKVLQNSWETFWASSQIFIVPLSLFCVELSPLLLY